MKNGCFLQNKTIALFKIHDDNDNKLKIFPVPIPIFFLELSIGHYDFSSYATNAEQIF